MCMCVGGRAVVQGGSDGCVWSTAVLFPAEADGACMWLAHLVDLTAIALPISGERTLSVSPSIRESSLSLGGKVFALNGTVSS